MNIENVVRVVEVRGRSTGVDQVARAYSDIASASEEASEAIGKNAREARSAADAINKLGVQLQDNYRQQQQFNDMVLDQARAGEDLVAANDNLSESYRTLGLELAGTANHLLRAGEAAYVFSPAFRQVVNGMAAPALRGASTALIAISAAMVTATNLAGRGLIELGVAAARSSSALVPVGSAIATIGAQMAAFNPTVTSVAASIASRLMPALSLFLRIAGPILLVKDAVGLLAEAWDLGGKKLEEYRQIAEKAAAVGLSTEYFQRLMKGAEAAKVPVDELTKALQNLQKASADQLGGSSLDQKIGKHLEAGNFGGNSGVGLLNQANTTEERFKAVAAIIREAMQAGQRLAALDLANTAFGPEITERLRVDSEYLDKILASAERVKDTELVSNEEIGRASELKARYDAAVKILETRWHPIQDALTQLGIRMQTAWVGIVEAIAQAFDAAARLVAKIGEIPQTFWGYIRGGANVLGKGVAAVAPSIPVVGPVIGAGGALLSAATTQEQAKSTGNYAAAVDRLRAGLQNQNAVQQAVNQTNTVANKVLGDNSKALDQSAKAVAQQNDAVDRASHTLERHIERQQADAKAIGLGDGALARFRVEAAQTAAIQANGGKITAEQVARFEQLKIAAYDAADALARANVAGQIKFRRQTIGLSQEDIEIAQQLRGIYGNDIPRALASTEAAELRLLNAQEMLADGFRNVGKEMFTAFVTGKDVMDAMIRSLDALASKLANAGFENLLSGIMSLNPAQAALGAAQAGASALISAFTSDQKADKELEEARKRLKDLTDQIEAFGRAADGIDLGPLTSSLMQLRQTYQQLALAALEARDYQVLANLQATFNRGVVRTIQAFEGASAVTNDLGAQLKAVADEGRGLIEFLQQYGLATETYIAGITASIARQQQELRDAFEKTLVADIRNNSGVGYLNTISDAIDKFNDYAAQGVNPNVLQAWLISTAQTAVNSAKLTGEAFDDMIAQFPQLANVVTAFVDAAADAAQKLSLQLRLLTATTDTSTLAGALTLFDAKASQERDAAIAAGISLENLALLDQALAAERFNIQKDFAQKAIDEERRLADERLNQMQRIQQYLDNLTGGSASTLSPGDRLSAASSQYAAQLSAARGGDASALSSITSYSQNVLDAARAYYGSTTGYQSIFAQVQSDLQGLIALTGAGAGAAATSSALSGSIAGVTPVTSSPAAANTNSWTDLKASMEAMKAEIITLRTALKDSIDKNTQAVAIAHTEEQEELSSIDDTLTAIRDGNALAASGSR